MRLTPKQSSAIISAFKSIAEPKTKLYLFGSRTKDHLKGGDIDLLILTETNEALKLLKNKKNKFRTLITSIIGEQKIDIKVALLSATTTDPFLVEIFSNAIILAETS